MSLDAGTLKILAGLLLLAGSLLALDYLLLVEREDEPGSVVPGWRRRR